MRKTGGNGRGNQNISTARLRRPVNNARTPPQVFYTLFFYSPPLWGHPHRVGSGSWQAGRLGLVGRESLVGPRRKTARRGHSAVFVACRRRESRSSAARRLVLRRFAASLYGGRIEQTNQIGHTTRTRSKPAPSDILYCSGRKGPRQGKGNGHAATDGVREPIFALREPARVSDAPTWTQMPSALHA